MWKGSCSKRGAELRHDWRQKNCGARCCCFTRVPEFYHPCSIGYILPTFGFMPNVGKYTIHGWYGIHHEGMTCLMLRSKKRAAHGRSSRRSRGLFAGQMAFEVPELQFLEQYPPRKLTWQSKTHHLKMYLGIFLYVMLVFRGVIQVFYRDTGWWSVFFFVLWEELHLCDSSIASVAKALQEAIKDNQVTWCWESFDGFFGESCECTNSGRDRWTSSWSVTWRMADIF